MAAAIESVIVVAIGFSGVAYFLGSLMTGTATLLHVAGGLGAFAAAWAYGIMRTY